MSVNNKGKPWSPLHSDAGGEVRQGAISIRDENCSGCGVPSVYGFIRQFGLFGYAEFCPSWPTPRFYKTQLSVATTTNTGPETCASEVVTCEATQSYETIPDTCANMGPNSVELCGVEEEVDGTIDCSATVYRYEKISIYDGPDPEINCDTTVSLDLTLSNEDTFSAASSRAAAASNICWPDDPYMRPLAVRTGDPWNCNECSIPGDCPDEVGTDGAGTLIPRLNDGLPFRGQENTGCINYHWGVTAVKSGLTVFAQAAKYRVIVPYDIAFPETNMEVTWKIVRRKNKGLIQTKGENAVGVNTVDTWRKTIELKIADEMTAPYDFVGSLHAESITWADFGFEIVPSGLEAVGGRVEKGTASRSKYKFVVHNGDTGTAAWDVEYLNGIDEVIQTDNLSVAIISGETEVQLLAPDSVEGAVKARLANLSVTDGDPLTRGAGIDDQWMLQAKIRIGKWGFAELKDPSPTPKFYTQKFTTYEHLQDGGGTCTTGCPGEPCGESSPTQAWLLTEIYTTVERLVDGAFVDLILADETSDGIKSCRWGRELYAPIVSKPSGRPNWFRPLGCNTSDTESGSYLPDPYTEATPTDTALKLVIEDVRTLEDVRTCGHLILFHPDPGGDIIGSEVKGPVTTLNEEDSTSLLRLKKIAGVPGANACIDYGNPGIGDGLHFSVADEAARLAATGYDGSESYMGSEDDELSGDCTGGFAPGAKVLQISDSTFWEVLGNPVAVCDPLTSEYWRQLRYKTTVDQFIYTADGDQSYWIEDIKAVACILPDEGAE